MRRCIRCDKEITNENKKFCSKLCRISGRVVLNCAYCNNEFSTVSSNRDSKYCSLYCKNKGIEKNKEYICAVCNKKFYRFEKYNSGKGSVFCSQKCRSSQKIKKYCPQCGRYYLVKPSLNHLKFCSIGCALDSRLHDKKRTCIYCNKEYTVRHPSYKTLFCSQKCMGLYRKKEENHYKTNCLSCGKEIETNIFDNRKYCSKKCYLNNSGISSIELLLKEPLEKIGFVPQYKYKLGHADYANPEKKVVVFVDGHFWHGREDAEWEKTPMSKSIERAIKRDKEQDKYLIDNNWVVLRFLDDYVQLHTDECIDEITEVVSNR